MLFIVTPLVKKKKNIDTANIITPKNDTIVFNTVISTPYLVIQVYKILKKSSVT